MVTSGELTCELCGGEISVKRREAMPGVKTCVACQQKVERGDYSAERLAMQDSFGNAERERVAPIVMDGGLVRVGSWSADMMEVMGKTVEVKGLVRAGKAQEARGLVQAMPLEAQAALVALDENPEEVLSLTAMDEKGRPGYSTSVVSRLPSETIAGIVSVRPEENEWNVALMKALTPDTFRRAVEETLDPIDDQATRGKVSYEWLRAVAAMDDINKAAELLRGCTPEVIEDALVSRLDTSQMNSVAAGVNVFRYFSEDGAGAMKPSRFIKGEVGKVLDELHDAAPGLMSEVVRRAWERTIESDDEDVTTGKDEEKNASPKRKKKQSASEAVREAAEEAVEGHVEVEEDEDADLSIWKRSE